MFFPTTYKCLTANFPNGIFEAGIVGGGDTVPFDCPGVFSDACLPDSPGFSTEWLQKSYQ